MNSKKTLLIICILTFTITNAQNLTLAKAFYKKAQQEYSNKNYTQVFKLLDKTKEQLGGQTNPEITYLEAKTHYNNDINITKAKKLLTQFLEEADPNDSRIDEISSLIVDIEVSDKIDEQGNFKDISGRSGIKTSYYDTGEKEWVQEYKKGKKNGFIKRYNKKGILIQSGSQKNGYVTGFYEWFNSEGKLRQTNFYNDVGNKTGEQRNYNTSNGKLQYIYTYSHNKKNGPYKYFYNDKLTTVGNYENDKLKGKLTNYYSNGKVSSTYTYNNTPNYDTKIPSYIEGIKTSYYFSGAKSSEQNYVKGKQKGAQKYFWANGNLKRWEHLNSEGKLYGERAYYYESNGKRSININYENGKAIELLEQIDVNGNKLKISKLKKGNGYIKRVNDAGIVIYEANFVNGYQEGVVKYYFNNGKLSSLSLYKNGKTINTSKYYFADGSLNSIYNQDTKKYTLTNYKDTQRKNLKTLIENNTSIDEIIAFCKGKNQTGKDFYLSESPINDVLGYGLMKQGRTEDALKIFKLNITFYPDAYNTYDSYGECLVKLGRIEEGITAYKKSLELNPKNTSAIEALKKLE